MDADRHAAVLHDANAAAAVLNSEGFKAAVKLVEAEQISRWRNAADLQTREDAHAMLRALDEIVSSLRAKMQGAALSARVRGAGA